MKGIKVPKLRLLPLVIFVAVLMLSVRLGNLWQDVSQVMAEVRVGQTAAQAQAAAPDAEGAAAPPTAAAAGPVMTGPLTAGTVPLAAVIGDMPMPSPTQPLIAQIPAPMASGALVQLAAAGAEGGEGGDQELPANITMGTATSGTDPLRDPVNFTQTEIDVLQKLAERREMIETRERELNTREGLLKAAEQRIDRKIADLHEVENTIQELLKKHDQQEQAKIDQLVKIYATMKPKDAARIFDDLEMDILLTIMENMKESKSAPILAAMTPDKARAVTAEMSNRRQIPLPGGGNG